MIDNENSAQVQINRTTITYTLVRIAICLILVHIAGLIFKYGFGHPTVFGLVHLFDLNEEGNVPTYFATLLHCTSALLLFLISINHKKADDECWVKWRILSMVFIYISVDEAAHIHELTIIPLITILGTSGLLLFAWVIPAFIIMLLFTVYFWTFFLQLPKNTRKLFFLAAAIFVGGAMGFELLEGYWVELHGTDNLIFSTFTTTEESMEMFGVIIFIYALLGYLSEHTPDDKLTINFIDEKK